MDQKAGKKRLAVLVGCNYANTPHELNGCINDALAMRDVLVKRFGFDQKHIELLTDAPDSLVMPTGANIKKALHRMVNRAEPGDVLFFHYSGHGTRIPSVRPGHFFGHDEAIVPWDFNLITDLDFRQIVNQLPKEASFTILSDSCHSGGLIEKEKEQIGPSSSTNEDSLLQSFKPKTIPFESVQQHLASLTNINTSDIGTHLLHFFGGDASLKFRLHPHEQDLLDSVKPDDGILLSGCQANEPSADMDPKENEGKAYGAFSNALQTVLKDHLDPLTNREVVLKTREVLKAGGYAQHSCLYCSDENADAPFLWQPDKTPTNDLGETKFIDTSDTPMTCHGMNHDMPSSTLACPMALPTHESVHQGHKPQRDLGGAYDEMMLEDSGEIKEHNYCTITWPPATVVQPKVYSELIQRGSQGIVEKIDSTTIRPPDVTAHDGEHGRMISKESGSLEDHFDVTTPQCGREAAEAATISGQGSLSQPQCSSSS